MTLSQFLDLAYACLVEEHVRLGANLLDALEETKEYAAGSKPVTAGGNTTVASRPEPVPAANVEAQNDQALMQLQAMMSGVAGGFG